ncbi:MAG: hypothetical protein QOE06_1040 [Thermoleophilaceae bacterium]|nr:hypothetical protein [Thermoleophilaceae bacterium]
MRRGLAALLVVLACSAALPAAAAAGPCRLTTDLNDLSEGRTDPTAHFPRGSHIKVLFLYADFAAGAGDPAVPSAITSEVGDVVSRYYSAQSYGRTQVTISSVDHWLRMPRSAADYGLDEGVDDDQYRRYLKDVVAAADPEVDFSAYDAVEVFNPEGVGLLRAQAYVEYPGHGIKVDGGELRYAAASADKADRAQLGRTMAHELGHDIGLPDLYDVGASYVPPGKPAPDAFRFSGDWDLMGSIGESVDMYAWHRLKLGWLRSSEVRCIVRGSSTATIAPINSPGGVKAIVARLSDSRAWVAEVRSEGPRGCGLGVLLYRVDANVESGSGPIRVVTTRRGPETGYCGALAHAPFSTGDPRSYTTSDGVRLDVLSSGANGYRARLSIAKRGPTFGETPPPQDNRPTHVFP